jgi:hypothetical protein
MKMIFPLISCSSASSTLFLVECVLPFSVQHIFQNSRPIVSRVMPACWMGVKSAYV